MGFSRNAGKYKPSGVCKEATIRPPFSQLVSFILCKMHSTRPTRTRRASSSSKTSYYVPSTHHFPINLISPAQHRYSPGENQFSIVFTQFQWICFEPQSFLLVKCQVFQITMNGFGKLITHMEHEACMLLTQILC